MLFSQLKVFGILIELETNIYMLLSLLVCIQKRKGYFLHKIGIVR